jgi:hypothetical protein
MTWLDGRGYAHWGPRGMPGLDALVSAAIISILLAHFVVSRRRNERMRQGSDCMNP